VCELYDLLADGSETAVEKLVDAAGGQRDGLLRNWTPLGDEIADHHLYTVTEEQYRQTDSATPR